MSLFDECERTYQELHRDSLCLSVRQFSQLWLCAKSPNYWTQCRASKRVPAGLALNLQRKLHEHGRFYRADAVHAASMVQAALDYAKENNDA